MKIAHRRLLIGALSLALLSTSLFVFAEEPSMEGKILGYAATPKLAETLGKFEHIAMLFAPQFAQPGMLSGMFGQFLGNPGLADVDASRPAAAFVFSGSEPKDGSLGLYVPMARDFQPAGSTPPGVHSEVVNDTLIVSPTSEGLEVAKKNLQNFNKIAKKKINDDLRIYVSLEDIHATYAGALKTSFENDFLRAQQVATDGGAEVTVAGSLLGLMKTYLHGLLAFLEHSKSIVAGLDLKDDSIDFRVRYRPRSGSMFDDFLRDHTVSRSPSLFHLPSEHYFALASQIDGERLATVLDRFAADLSKRDPEVEKLLSAKALERLSAVFKLLSGDGAVVMRSTKASPMSYEYSFGVRDGSAFLDRFEELWALYAPDQPIGEFLGSAGLTVKTSFERKVRRYKDVLIHRIVQDFTGVKDPASQQVFAVLPNKQEIAVVDSYCLMATSPGALNKIIERVVNKDTSEVALKSVVRYGADKNLYLDFDVLGYFRLIGAMANAQGLNVFPTIDKKGEPILANGTVAGGRATFHGHVPLQPFVDIAQAFTGFHR